jgi:hypothetical protein
MTSRRRGAALALALAAPALAGGAGCTINWPDFPKANVTQTSLAAADFQYVGTGLRAEDSGLRFLGIGGVPQMADVMQDLRVQAHLEQGARALVNVTEDHSTTYFLIVTIETITITADVIEFTRSGAPGGR